MKQRGNWYVILLIVILVASLVMLVLENISAITGNVPSTPLTGYLTEGSTWSNVTIEYYLAIQMSQNLTDGIDFGTVYDLPTFNQNATKNYDTNNQTQYFINVSLDSNTNVTFCIYANSSLKTLANDEIGLGNETFASNTTTTDLNIPSLSNETSMTTSYQLAALNIGVGKECYWRFWLDIPVATPAGNYNNTVNFKGMTYGTACSGP